MISPSINNCEKCELSFVDFKKKKKNAAINSCDQQIQCNAGLHFKSIANFSLARVALVQFQGKESNNLDQQVDPSLNQNHIHTL